MTNTKPLKQFDICITRLAELDARGDYAGADDLCNSVTCSDCVECQRYLGWRYADQGDPVRGCQWYARAALNGSEDAIVEHLQCAQLVADLDDRRKVTDIYALRPFADDSRCQRFLLELYYAQGDLGKALKQCLQLSIMEGNQDDLVYVGKKLLADGELHEAVDFFVKASNMGNGLASQIIGEMHNFGIGIENDQDAALKYYKIAANQGYLLSKVRIIHIERGKSSGWVRFASFACLVGLIFRVSLLKIFSPKDARLAGVNGQLN